MKYGGGQSMSNIKLEQEAKDNALYGDLRNQRDEKNPF